MGEEITIDEGYIITIEDGKAFLLLRQIKNYFLRLKWLMKKIYQIITVC